MRELRFFQLAHALVEQTDEILDAIGHRRVRR